MIEELKKHFHILESDAFGDMTFDNYFTENPEIKNTLFRTYEDKGKTMNPVFVLGEPGNGSTHLLVSYLKDFIIAWPDKSVMALPGDTARIFQEMGLIEKRGRFRRALNSCDLLLIDDMNIYLDRGPARDALLGVLHNRVANEKLSILTYSKLPPGKEWKPEDFQELTAAVTVISEKPSVPSRMRVLMKLLKDEKKTFLFNEYQLDFTARVENISVRTLESVFLLMLLIAKERNVEFYGMKEREFFNILDYAVSRITKIE